MTGDLEKLWAIISFWILKIELCAVGKNYAVAVLLTNAHTDFYGSQIGSFFNLDHPLLEQYFKWSDKKKKFIGGFFFVYFNTDFSSEALFLFAVYFFKLWFSPCKDEDPLQSIEL